MKLGLTWPVEPEGLRSFARGLERIVVVEEKRGFVESQVKEILYGAVHRPLVLGKEDETGRPLFPATMELDSGEVALALVRAIPALSEDAALADRRARLETAVSRRDAPIALRTPFFCAGCPHNTSTVTPDESLAIGGIGCHTLAAYMDRDVRTYTHMGGEGASWIGLSPFTDLEHVFQNVGDGTYMHSGSMGIRAAVAAGVNVTFKILYNDAVAMTGGQPVEGGVTVAQLTRQLAAEGVAPIVVVSDEPEKFAGSGDLAPGTTVHHRDRLDAVQRSLRETTGVSALVYEQTCAAEKRRRRKRDAFPDPPRRVVINELVCEGCGHCGTVSNCVAIVPVETPFGRKRQIDQTACNKDFSCLKGFCPSFVTVEGRLKQGAAGSPDYAPPPVPEPDLPSVAEPYAILIAGTGGTGVVTVGALLGTAARIDGLACSVNDVTGMAQKGGPVLSHVTLAPSSHGLHAIRIPAGAARLLLGADLVVSTMPDAMRRLAPGTTRAVVNAHRQMTGDFTRNADQAFPDDAMRNALRAAVGADVSFLGASNAAVALTGDATAANLLLLGHAWQKGWVPLSRDAIESAIRLNGARIEDNLAAFAWGRALAHDPSLESRFPAAEDDGPETLDALIARRAGFLADYQNAAYAARYSRLVESVRAAEREICGTTALTEAVARGAFKLMAYKDEYEVARLHTDAAFHARIAAMFEDGFRLSYHLAPPIMGGEPDPRTGQPRKRAFGPWMLVAFRLLARLRVLRGTRLDPFGRTAERRAERALIAAYERTVAELCAALAPETLDLATEIASLPERIRGYGAIKDASIAAATAREADLLARLRDPKKRAA